IRTDGCLEIDIGGKQLYKLARHRLRQSVGEAGAVDAVIKGWRFDWDFCQMPATAFKCLRHGGNGLRLIAPDVLELVLHCHRRNMRACSVNAGANGLASPAPHLDTHSYYIARLQSLG